MNEGQFMKKLINFVIIVCGASIFGGALILSLSLTSCSNRQATMPVSPSSTVKADQIPSGAVTFGCNSVTFYVVSEECVSASNCPPIPGNGCVVYAVLIATPTGTLTPMPSTPTFTLTPASTTPTVSPTGTQASQTPTPTVASPTATPTVPLTNTPTVQPTDTPTVPPTNTPIPTNTFTPIPTNTPVFTPTQCIDACPGMATAKFLESVTQCCGVDPDHCADEFTASLCSAEAFLHGLFTYTECVENCKMDHAQVSSAIAPRNVNNQIVSKETLKRVYEFITKNGEFNLNKNQDEIGNRVTFVYENINIYNYDINPNFAVEQALERSVRILNENLEEYEK